VKPSTPKDAGALPGAQSLRDSEKRDETDIELALRPRCIWCGESHAEKIVNEDHSGGRQWFQCQYCHRRFSSPLR
jgi:hypothetical protein